MTHSEMGLVFSYLLKHRVAFSDPIGRRRRPDEANIVKILSDALSEDDLQDFEEFLNIQGFSVRYYEGTDFGIIKGMGRIPRYFVMARTASDPPQYIDRRWIIQRLSDARLKEPPDNTIIWAIQIWLMINSFFYTQIGRAPSEVLRYMDALVSVRALTDTLNDFVERLRSEGRPENEKGVVWDVMTSESRQNIERRVRAFLNVMLEAGQTEDAGNEDEYRQSLLASVEMSLNAEKGLSYLMPLEEEGSKRPDVVDVIKGYKEEEDVLN